MLLSLKHNNYVDFILKKMIVCFHCQTVCVYMCAIIFYLHFYNKALLTCNSCFHSHYNFLKPVRSLWPNCRRR